MIHNHSWEDPANWSGGDGTKNYPGWDGKAATTGDTASFINNPSFMHTNDPATMASAHTLFALSINSYTGTLTLQAALTLSGGTSAMTSGTIVQQNAASITLGNGDGTAFSWTGGDINPGGPAATFVVSAPAVFNVQQMGAAASKFGDDLNNSGLMNLGNSNVGGVTLVNRPVITNTGTIGIMASNPNGLVVAAGDPVVTIQNTGTIHRGGTDHGTYEIDDPVNNSASGSQILVDPGQTLRFKGADPTTGYSLNQSQGLIQVKTGATLQPDSGLYLTGGTTMAFNSTTINGRVYMVGGTLQQGDGTAATLGTMHIGGTFNFQGGTLVVFVDRTNVLTPNGHIYVDGGGGVTVNGSAAQVQVSFIGNQFAAPAVLPEVIFADALGASISDVPKVLPGSGYAKAVRHNGGTGTNNDLYVEM